MARTEKAAAAPDSLAADTAAGQALESGSSPAAALLSALNAEPEGATTAALAAQAGLSATVARKARAR